MIRKFLFTCSVFLYSVLAQAQQLMLVGAEQIEIYLPELIHKKVGMVVNQTSVIGSTHLVDTLLAKGVQIKAIYAPEHGYKGNVERGKSISNSKDSVTGIPVYSIYGNKKKPTPDDLKDIEMMIFDMQVVGVRFFTYISTLHYIMEACAENNIDLLLLDRPNPLGYYIDGPVLDPKFKSFIGMHPIPIVHGMTIGEYAYMINGEGWLNKGIQCNLKVIKVAHYNHHSFYTLPVRPSPNLPDMKSIYLYPSICLFEGTEVSEGRGTEKPFQQFGTPAYTSGKHQFIPKPIPSMSISPKYEGEICYGYDLSESSITELQDIKEVKLHYLIEFYHQSTDKQDFFQKSFDLLAGSDQLRKQIVSGKSEQEIRESWLPGLENFKKIREKYLLYDE